MKTIYLNCENGVSGDMVLNALIGLTEDPETVRANIAKVTALIEEKGSGAHDHEELGIHSHGHGHHHDHEHHHDHDHGHEHHHDHDHEHHHDHGHGHHHGHSDQSHRSYREVMEIISSVPVSSRIKIVAEQIYAVIAKAESTVHGEPLETLHFHEVGRDQAIANSMGVAVCMDALRPDQVMVVEDNRNGIQAAEAAGAHVMKVDTVYDVNYDNIRAHLARFDSEEGGVRP